MRFIQRTRSRIPLLLDLILRSKPTFDDFEYECELSRPTVARILHDLEYRRVLSIRRGRGCVRNEYRINGGQHDHV